MLKLQLKIFLTESKLNYTLAVDWIIPITIQIISKMFNYVNVLTTLSSSKAIMLLLDLA